MTTLARLRGHAQSVISAYFELSRKAEENRERETKAAVLIESAARGFLIRRRLLHFTKVIITIQRYWRGYIGRLKAKAAGEVRDQKRREAYFNAKATVIQRHWRGFWSRKNLFDFYVRKAYLRSLHLTNKAVRSELNEEAKRAAEEQRQIADETARKTFDERISKLHHLVSTTSQPGIFASPYQMATGTIPVVAGKTVEHHLKQAFKSQAPQFLPPIRKTTGKSTGPLDFYSTAEIALPNGKKVAPHVTLRQSAAYTAIKEEKKIEEKIHRAEMLNVHPLGPFSATGKAPYYPPINPQTNRNVETFRDAFDPTVGVRNETFGSPAQLAISNQAFNRHLHKQNFFDPVMNKDDGTMD